MTQPITIRRSLLTNLISVVLLLGGAIVLMMALGRQRAVRDLSGSLIQQASLRTEVKLRGFFDPVSRQVEGVKAWGDSGLLALDDPEGLLRLLTPVLHEIPWSSQLFVVDERGREYLLRREGRTWSDRQVWRDEWGDRALTRTWSDQDPKPVVREERLDYDPRDRPWYQGALESVEADDVGAQPAGVFWTDPYRFYGTGRLGMTASAATRRGSAGVFVVGMDIELTEISRFTTAIRLLDEGRVFVLTEDGRMVGIPSTHRGALSDGEIEPWLLKRPEEIGTRAAQDAADRLLTDPSGWGRPVRLVSDGEPWWGQITAFPLSQDRRLLIGVAVEEADILGQIRHQRLWVAGLTLAAVALAVWRAVDMARRYSRPVEALVEESGRIREGDLAAGPPIRTRIAEVQQLAQAHERMRVGLKTLLKLERDLQVARQIRQGCLPRRLPQVSGFDVSTWNQPADETGGDSYDVIGLARSADSGGLVLTDSEADRVVLMLADATGHGIGPALSVTQLRAMLRMAIRLGTDLPGLVSNINQQLAADLPSNRFITAWFGLLDDDSHTLGVFSAGQAPLLHYVAAEDRFEISGSNAPPLGLFPLLRVEAPEPIALASGDLYAVLSDGFFEAKNPADVEQGSDRICDVIRRHRSASAAEIARQIRAATESFTGGSPPDDDRTLIVIKRS